MSFLSLVKRIYREFSEDRIPAVAAGITFFFLLALFPGIASVVSLYGLIADRHSIIEAVRMASSFLPEGAVRILRTDILRLVTQRSEDLGWAFAFGLVLAIWSASGGVKALIDGLNIAFETKDERSFVRVTWDALLFTLLGAGGAALAVYLAISVSKLLAALPFDSALERVFSILVWPIGFCACSAVISLIYRFAPNRQGAPWRWISWGSAFASAAWILGTIAFSWYVAHFGRYDRTYGDLGAAVGFLTWVWLSLVILLTGAEIVSETEKADAAPAPQVRRSAQPRAAAHPVRGHRGQAA